MKNIGSTSISYDELDNADVFIGPSGDFDRATFHNPPSDLQWIYILDDLDGNNEWGIGETLEIYTRNDKLTTPNEYAYFQFVLPNGVYRSVEFTIV